MVGHQGETPVVEFEQDESAVRAIIPAEDLPGGQEAKVPDEVLEAAPRISVPWAGHYTVTVTAAKVERELHRAGIWTLGDLKARWNKARAIVQRLATRDLLAMLKSVEEEN